MRPDDSCEGTCLEHIERQRNDEAFLNAIGADSIPDPAYARYLASARAQRDELGIKSTDAK